MNLKSVRVGTSMVAVIISLTIWISLLFPLGTVLAQGNQQYSYVSEWGPDGKEMESLRSPYSSLIQPV